MPTPEIEEFAKELVRHVRDMAITSCDRLLNPNARTPIALRWQQAGDDHAIRTVIPDAIDEAVGALLRAVDNGELRLKFVAKSGKEIDLTEDGLGELVGWYIGTGGWRAMYSGERFVDDFANLT